MFWEFSVYCGIRWTEKVVYTLGHLLFWLPYLYQSKLSKPQLDCNWGNHPLCATNLFFCSAMCKNKSTVEDVSELEHDEIAILDMIECWYGGGESQRPAMDGIPSSEQSGANFKDLHGSWCDSNPRGHLLRVACMALCHHREGYWGTSQHTLEVHGKFNRKLCNKNTDTGGNLCTTRAQPGTGGKTNYWSSGPVLKVEPVQTKRVLSSSFLTSSAV